MNATTNWIKVEKTEHMLRYFTQHFDDYFIVKQDIPCADMRLTCLSGKHIHYRLKYNTKHPPIAEVARLYTKAELEDARAA